MGDYDIEFAPEDLPVDAPPGLDMISEPQMPQTPLENFIQDGSYVVYRQKPE